MASQDLAKTNQAFVAPGDRLLSTGYAELAGGCVPHCEVGCSCLTGNP